MKKAVSVFVLFVLVFSGMAVPAYEKAWSDTFFGELPTGPLELQNYRYPVYLYVPEGYKPDRDYPMIVSVPDEGEGPESQLKYWAGIAKRRSMFVLAPTNLWPEDVPYSMDEWLLGILSDVAKRYRIDSSKTFLVGRKSGAHYAAYLGTNHPENFSSVVLIEGAWSGQFEELMKPKKRTAKQIPFLVVASGQDEGRLSEIEKEARVYENRGYPVALMKVENWDQTQSDEFRKKVLEWLETKSETWQSRVRESRKSWKEKSKRWFENFFHV